MNLLLNFFLEILKMIKKLFIQNELLSAEFICALNLIFKLHCSVYKADAHVYLIIKIKYLIIGDTQNFKFF